MPLALKVTEDPDLREPGAFSMRGHSSRRLRLGDDEQGHRHDRRRRVRQGRAGLSQVRLGKEGPADDVLPDDRRRAHLAAQRAGVRRPGRAQRHDGPVQRQSAGGPGRRRGDRHAVVVRRARPTCGSGFPQHHKQFIREKKLRVYYADMVQIAREVASVADLQMRMQGIVLLGAFLKLTPYGTQSGMTDEQVYARRRKGPPQVLRQARRPRRARQPDLRQARLQRNAGSAAGDDSER